MAWATTVKQVLGYKHTNGNSTVNTFKLPNSHKLFQITAKQMHTHIMAYVKKMGPKKLGMDINRVGAHSLCLSCVMLLYLAEVRTSTIMLLGCWKSDAFLIYLRKQVKEFTKGISTTMTDQPSTFFAIPNSRNSDLLNRHRSDRDDPMTSNTNLIASHTRFHCPGFTGNTSSAIANNHHTPAFRIWG